MKFKIPLFAVLLVFVTLMLIPVKHFNQIDCYMSKLPDKDYLRLTPPSDGFDFPVGPPNAKGYYIARSFGELRHLGEDWNGLGGRNSDLGDSVYAVSNGLVIFSKNCGAGWGNIIRVIHHQPPDSYTESLYAHMENRLAEAGQVVSRGEPIGTIGNADGRYYAHLHFELRTITYLPIGKGYDKDTTGHTSPTNFIEANRPSQSQ